MGLENYKSTDNFVEDKYELITKLYDKIILNLKYIEKYKQERKQHIVENRIEKVNQIIDIIELLKDSLDMKTPNLKASSEYLYGLYEYQLLNMYKLTLSMDENILKSLLNVFTELKAGWEDSVFIEKQK